MKYILKIICKQLLIVLFMMFIVCFCDFFGEKSQNENIFSLFESFFCVLLLILNLGIPILYLVFQKNIHFRNFSKLKNRFLFLGIYILLNFFIGNGLTNLALNDLWIIKQDFIGLENMFNGCEYFFYGIFNGFSALIIVLVYDLVFFIYTKIKI